MAERAALLSVEQGNALWQDYLRRQQLQPHIQTNYPQRRPIDEVSPHRIFVRNDSGEEIPKYGCMQITGTAEVAGVTLVTVDKPTTTTGQYLINSQFAISIDANGWAYRFGVVVMLGDPPSSIGVSYTPIIASWEVEEGNGPLVIWGEHNADARGLIGRIGTTGGGTHRIYFTVVDYLCISSTEVELTVTATWYTGGCTAAIPGTNSYDEITVIDPCGKSLFFAAIDLIGKSGFATYMYPRTGTCEPKWLLDDLCGIPECS